MDSFVLTLTIIAIFSSLSAVALTYFFFVSQKQLRELQKNLTDIRHQFNTLNPDNKNLSPEEAIVIAANKKAQTIIKEASDRAAKLVNESALVSDQVREKLDKDLERLPQAQADIYRSVFKKVGDDAIKILDDVGKDMKLSSEEQIKNFASILREKAEENQKDINKQIKEAFARVEKDIAEYQHMRQKKVDDTIFQVLHEVSREVINKSLPLHEHEELVRQALQAAKQASIF